MSSLWAYVGDNLLPLLTVIGGIIVWLFDKNKRRAELKGMQVTNEQSEVSIFKSMQESYKVLKEEMDQALQTVREEVKRLREENEVLKQAIFSSKERISELESQLESANSERTKLENKLNEVTQKSANDTKLIKSLKAKVDSYEKDFKIFRKEHS